MVEGLKEAIFFVTSYEFIRFESWIVINSLEYAFAVYGVHSNCLYV